MQKYCCRFSIHTNCCMYKSPSVCSVCNLKDVIVVSSIERRVEYFGANDNKRQTVTFSSFFLIIAYIFVVERAAASQWWIHLRMDWSCDRTNTRDKRVRGFKSRFKKHGRSIRMRFRLDQRYEGLLVKQKSFTFSWPHQTTFNRQVLFSRVLASLSFIWHENIMDSHLA